MEICLIAFTSSLLLSIALTGLILFLSRKYHWYPPPPPGRWAKTPRPIWGGVGMFSAALVTAVAILSWQPQLFWRELTFWVAFGLGSSIAFGLGLWDDLSPVSPLLKLGFQFIIAGIVLAFGIHLPIFRNPLLDVPLSVLWIVGVTNSFNLLDNMDGLSAGIGCIASILLFLYSWQLWPLGSSLALALIGGVTLGFLVWNFHPAKIFMGDSGSLFLGFSLAVLAIRGAHVHQIDGILPPLLVLAIPLLDTAFVVCLRWSYGRGIFQGGTDHLSHRLVALGLTERSAVLLLYLITLIFGIILLFFKWFSQTWAWLLAALSFSSLVYFLLLVGEVPVYGHREKEKRWRVEVRKYGSTLLLMAADVFLLSVSFVGSYLIRFEGNVPLPFWQMIFQGLPLFLSVEILVFYLSGVYHLSVERFSLTHLKKLFWASTWATICMVLVATMTWRFTNYSRAVFFIHWLLSLLLLSSSRSLIQVYCLLLNISLPIRGALLGHPQVLSAIWEELTEEERQEIQTWILPQGAEAVEPPENVEVMPLDLGKDWSQFAFIVYLKGQLSPKEREHIEEVALKQGVSLASLRNFLCKEL